MRGRGRRWERSGTPWHADQSLGPMDTSKSGRRKSRRCPQNRNRIGATDQIGAVDIKRFSPRWPPATYSGFTAWALLFSSTFSHVSMNRPSAVEVILFPSMTIIGRSKWGFSAASALPVTTRTV